MINIRNKDQASKSSVPGVITADWISIRYQLSRFFRGLIPLKKVEVSEKQRGKKVIDGDCSWSGSAQNPLAKFLPRKSHDAHTPPALQPPKRIASFLHSHSAIDNSPNVFRQHRTNSSQWVGKWLSHLFFEQIHVAVIATSCSSSGS
jgi:hypothetical protein